MAEYAFCEPVTATTSSFEHIREVPEKIRRLGGGIEGKALCGRDMTRGWDNMAQVTEHSVRLRSRRPSDHNPVPNPLCRKCADLWGQAEVEDWEGLSS